MNKKLILAATIACSISSALALGQAYPPQSNPWEAYWPQVRQTSDDDISFEIAPKGVFGFAADKEDPDLGGGLMSFGASIKTGKFINEITLTTGWLGGKKNYNAYDLGEMAFDLSPQETQAYLNAGYNVDARMKVSSVPFMIGYTFNAPIVEDRTYFFVGGKAGFAINRAKTTANLTIPSLGTISEDYTDNETDPVFSITTGIRVFMDENASFMMGYEFFRIAGTDNKASYHMVEAGFIFTF